MSKKNSIVEHLTHPQELERMYRQDPEAFRSLFAEAWAQHPDSTVLAVWHERLFFKEETGIEHTFKLNKDFLVMAILAILAGITTRIIMFFVEQETISYINLVFGVTPFLVAYLVYRNPSRKIILYGIILVFVFSMIYLNLLPLTYSDSIDLAYLHFLLLAWIIIGLAFTGNGFKERNSRLAFLKFNGEFAVLYVIMAISGGILTALTIQLFNLLNLDIAEFYSRNVVLFGAASLSVVATYMLVSRWNLAKQIAPFIARIFSPLVLVTLVVYLATVLWIGMNPFLNRDFLLTFNAILLGVLAVTLYSITERGEEEKKHIYDYVNFALITVTLLIDSLALSAIVFRLSSFGITPNRLAILGINLLIWGNLIWLLLAYFRFLRNKTGLSSVKEAITMYLPVYGIWAAFVTFIFPILFM